MPPALPSQTVSDVEKMAPHVATRPVSPPSKDADEQSICVSPSWEAHGRRRKEKKMEKREKEEAAKTAQAKRKSRLSKQPPPASSTDALRNAGSTVPDPRGRSQDRPANAGVKSPDKEAAPRKSRSRSGSFASLIRSPLGFRRQSVDLAAEPEFIGGIKLELERHLANDRTLDQQASGDDACLHPALRPDASSDQRLRSPPPPGHAWGEAKSPVKRTYPPITRHEKHPRNRALVSLTAPAVPDLSKIDRWRARVGLRPTSHPSTPTFPGPEPQPGEEVDAGDELDGHNVQQPPSHGPTDGQAAERRAMNQAHHTASTGVPAANEVQGEANDARGLSFDDVTNGYGTAPSTPPHPPLRSPRRSSLPHADDPRLPADGSEAVRVSCGSDASPSGQLARKVDLRRSSTPLNTAPTSPAAPSGADEQGAEPVPLDASREGVRLSLSPVLQAAEAKAQKSPTQMSWTTQSKSLPVSSPDESGSDEFHSPSPPSSPATSRSESDKGMSTLTCGAKGLPLDSTASKVTHGEARPPAREPERASCKEDDRFKDQALAPHHEATTASPSVERRSLLPVPNRQTPPPKDTGSSSRFSRLPLTPGNQSGRAPQSRATSPRPDAASYLEEARRLPPVPTTRGTKTRLGPPASFSLPGDLRSPTTTRAEGSRLSEACQYPPHLTTTGVGLPGHTPTAKMFVECCSCKFYHDMPSNLYEAMANPESALSGRDTMGYAGAISMTVKCPWCRHEMSTRCCAGLAAMVYVTERLH